MVVGMGGVGSWCAEMLCRAGVGHLVLVDGDTVDSHNRNRQLPALASTLGHSKVEVCAIFSATLNCKAFFTKSVLLVDEVICCVVRQRRRLVPYQASKHACRRRC